jgi:hypothetical protein
MVRILERGGNAGLVWARSSRLYRECGQMSQTIVKESPAGVSPRAPKSEGLRVLDWRSEILQAMYWLGNEGIADDVDAVLLGRFLGAGSRVDGEDLDGLLDEGYVERVGSRYRLSEAGTRKARLEFMASFDEFTRPTPAECSRAAWCDLISRLRSLDT